MFGNNDSIISLSDRMEKEINKLEAERADLLAAMADGKTFATTFQVERLLWIDAERRVNYRVKQMADYRCARLAEYAQNHTGEEFIDFNAELMAEIRREITSTILSAGWINSSSEITVLAERMISHTWSQMASTAFYAE